MNFIILTDIHGRTVIVRADQIVSAEEYEGDKVTPAHTFMSLVNQRNLRVTTTPRGLLALILGEDVSITDTA
jgi:hypothetical protein